MQAPVESLASSVQTNVNSSPAAPLAVAHSAALDPVARLRLLPGLGRDLIYVGWRLALVLTALCAVVVLLANAA